MFKKNCLSVCIGAMALSISLSLFAFAPFGETNDTNTHEGIIQNIYDQGGNDYAFDTRGWGDYGMPNSATALEDMVGDADLVQDAENHCDNETIEACHNFIFKKTVKAINLMRSDYWDTGYIFLGQALHAIQDFYAHSNWFQLNKTSFDAGQLPILDYFGKYRTIEHIPPYYGYDNLSPEAFKQLLRNFFFNDFPLASSTVKTCKKNSNGSGNYKYITGLGHLTSGYVGATEMPNDEKCNHGGGQSTITHLLGALDYGINKDEPSVSIYTPHRANFSKAYAAAEKATISHLKYVAGYLNTNRHFKSIDKILKDVADPLGINKQFKAADKTDKSFLTSIFSAGFSVAFGISGKNEVSMVDDLEQALTVTTKRSTSDKIAVKQYLLSIDTLNGEKTKRSIDGKKEMMLSTQDRDKLLDKLDLFSATHQQVDGLKAFKRGGKGQVKNKQIETCSALSISQLRDLVIKTNSSGNVYFYTDASSNNQQQALSDITALALRKGIILNYLTTDCGSNDQGFQQSAHLTGGEVISVASHSAKDKKTVGEKIKNIIEPVLAGKMRTLLIVSGKVKTGTHFVPVDSSMSTISISIQHARNTQINLIDPNGRKIAMNGNQKNVQTTSLANGTLISIQKPAIGLWKIQLSGEPKSLYNLTVKSQSPVGFPVFQFFEPGLNYMGEMVTFRLQNTDPVVKSYQSKAVVAGNLSQVQFELRSLDGRLLESLDFQNNAKNTHRFSGKVDVPAKAFRVYMTALNTEGEMVTRVFPRVFEGKSLQLSLQGMNKNILKVGDNFSAKLKVTNLGKDNKFHVVVKDQFGLSNNDFDVALENGGSELFDIDFSIPEEIRSGTEIILTFIVSSVNGDKKEINRQVQSVYVQ